ncbi:MAG: PAS domain S-box protein [[Ruminococcus] lactaris]|uniref:PAS domain S-box protein n=1 Tax=[Ruminococcus] lactaris TaxID=46228 RepID=UPI0039A3EC6D
MEEANEWLDAIIEHSFDGIYITDGNANTIKANRAYETITGLKKSEVLGLQYGGAGRKRDCFCQRFPDRYPGKKARHNPAGI